MSAGTGCRRAQARLGALHHHFRTTTWHAPATPWRRGASVSSPLMALALALPLAGVAAQAQAQAQDALETAAESTPSPSLSAAANPAFAYLGRLILGAGTEKVAIDTPQAVSVLEQGDLDRLQPENLGDLFQAMPGVSAAGSSVRPGGQAFNIRGIGNAEQTASQARIIVNVDGAPKFFEQYRMGSFFGDLELYKRVEVLRGPGSSTLYGSGAIGGVVNFTTKDASDFLAPGQDQAVRMKGSWASNGAAGRLGVIWASRPSEAFEFLGALNRAEGRDVQDGDGNDIPGSAHSAWSGLAKAKLRLGDDGDRALTVSASRTDSDLDDTVVAQTGGAVASAFGTSDMRTRDDTLTIRYDDHASANPWLDLNATLSYSKTRVEKDNFSLGMMCAPGTMQVLCDNEAAYETLTLRLENTAELHSGAWQNYLTFGLQFSEQERTADSSVGSLAFHPGGTDRKAAAYVQGEFIWNDRLTLTPGLRVERAALSPDDDARSLGGRAQSDTALSPKLAAMYRLNDDWQIFGSVARTERLPTLDELYATQPGSGATPARLPSLNLRKETATTIEAGLTWQRGAVFTPEDGLAMKATLFHNDVKDLIATTARVSGGPDVPYYSNINAAKIWGAEIEATYDAARWFAQAAYSQVKSKDESTGQTLTDTPAENFALTLGVKFPDQDLTLSWRGLWHDAITTASSTTSGKSFASHDLFVNWQPETGALAGLEVNLAVENLFDASYRDNLQLDNAAGRSVKLSLAKTF